jgi:hypothetical protein
MCIDALPLVYLIPLYHLPRFYETLVLAPHPCILYASCYTAVAHSWVYEINDRYLPVARTSCRTMDGFKSRLFLPPTPRILGSQKGMVQNSYERICKKIQRGQRYRKE